VFILRGIGKGLKWLGGAIVAPIAKLRQRRGFWRIVRCIVHALAIAAIVAALAWVNYFFELDTYLRTPWPILRLVWLPLLFLLCYALLWLGWYVCRAIASDGEPSPFPEIERAWQSAINDARQAGIDVARTPLYLLVGRPRGRMHDLIHAAGVPLVTAPSAGDDETPVQVFANREAIFVSCAGVSLLGRQAELLAQAAAQRRQVAEPWPDENHHEPADADVAVDEIPVNSPAGDGDGGSGVATQTTSHPLAAAAHDRLSQLEGHVATLVGEEAEGADAAPQSTFAECESLETELQAALLKDAAEVETISARLRYLCRLIVDERCPHVPVNAVVLMASADAMDADEAAGHVGVLAAEDLDVIHEATQVECPDVFLLCDVEDSPGGTELIARFPEQQRHRRLGVRLPEVACADAAEAGELVHEAVRWLCDDLLPAMVHRLVQTPQTDAEHRDALSSNKALYHFLYRMRQRRERLARSLRRAIIGAGGVSHRLAGCYLVATGEDGRRRQGFAEAVFAQLPELAQTVAWTPAAIRRDRRQHMIARCGYVALASLAAVLGIAILAF